MHRIIDILLASISLNGILLSIITLLFKVNDLDKIELDIQTMILILIFAAILSLIIAILLACLESYLLCRKNELENSSLNPFLSKFLWIIAIIIFLTAIYLAKSRFISTHLGLSNIKLPLSNNLKTSEFYSIFSSFKPSVKRIVATLKSFFSLTLPFNQEKFGDSSFITVYTFGLTALILPWSMVWTVTILSYIFENDNTFKSIFTYILVTICMLYPILWGEYVLCLLVDMIFTALHIILLLPNLVISCTINFISGIFLFVRTISSK